MSTNVTTPDTTLTTGSDVDMRGLSRHRLDNKWEIKLSLNGKNTYIGRSNSLANAIRMRDEARLRRTQKIPKARVVATRVMKHGVQTKNDGVNVKYIVAVYHKGKRHYGGTFTSHNLALEKAVEIKKQLAH